MITTLSIRESNLSHAWAKAFLATMEKGGDTRHPSVVTISDLHDDAVMEDLSIRARLDEELGKHGVNLCDTVANTIFPQSMWNPALPNDADVLFSRYEKSWPGIKKCPANRNGVYFRRLTAYQSKGHPGDPVNQLESIVETYRSGNHRKSALQASILDPTRDHSDQRQKGFPCMQQVAFTPLKGATLSVTGFYATQYQFEKAYGNYLGLYWLGRFMAKQLGLTLTQITCIASVLQRGQPGKGELTSLADDVRAMLEPI